MPWGLVIFNLVAMIGFSVFYIANKNYEFVFYVGVMIFFFGLIFATLKRSKFDMVILGGLTLWGLLHMAGGGIMVNGDVLYSYQIFHIVGSGDAFILKFDQFVHFLGFGVSTLIFHHLLSAYLGDKVNYKVLYPLVVLGGMGVGAFNEIIEFLAVVALPETGVGGYMNTSIDMVFNTLGAITAAFVIHYRRKPKPGETQFEHVVE